MDEPAIFVPPGVVSVVHPTKSASSYDENAEPKSMECEDADWQTDKRNTTTTEEIASWDDICRVCANARDHMIPIFENEGAEHKLINKICMYLPIEVSNTDSLPLKLCYHCAATLLAWHELVTGCLDAEKRLLQMQAERIQRRESCRLKNSQISTSNELAEEIVTAIEESVDEYQTTTTPKSGKPNVSTASLEVPLQERIDQLTSGEKSNSNEGQEAIALSELVDDPEATATEESHESRVAREETEPRPIHEQEAPCATLQELESTSENVERCAVSRETNERSGRVKKPFKLFIDAQSLCREERKVKVELTDGKSVARIDDEDTTRIRNALHPSRLDSPGPEDEGLNSAEETFPKAPGVRRNSPRSARLRSENLSAECGQIFAEKSEDSEDHGSMTYDESMTVKCTVCCRKFAEIKDLQIHARDHKDLPESRKIYQCVECDKSFRLKDSFVRHRRIHRDERPFTCHVCGKQFRDSGGLSRHLKDVHAKLKNFPCDMCGNCFSSKATRDDHRRTHTGERPYVCDTCSKSFKSKACLYSHSKLHTNEFPHPCAYCSKKFRRRQEMLVHATTHTGEKNHSCDVCFMRFRVKTEVARHKLTHSEEKPFVCSKCGLRFRQNRYLNNHIRLRHTSGGTRQRRFATFRRKRTDGKPAGKSTAAGGESSRRAGRRDSGIAAKKREARVTVKSRSNGGEEARKQSACEKCSRVFVREANFKRHVANCRGKRKSEKATDSPREQNSQQRKDAEEAAADENAGTSRLAEAAEWDEDDEADVWEEREVASKKPTYNNYPCLYCEYTTKRKKLLNQHTNEFHPDASGMKHGISQRSVDRELVRRAKMEANGRVYYHCKDCGKNLFSPYTFTWHVRIHTGERPFTCHLCGKQFRVNQGLARHLRETHAGIKRFPCDLCGRMFSTKRNVEDHRRIHTGERPFVCNVCGKAFKQKASLFVHNRTHSDFFPFKCSYCGQEFRTRPPLVIHLTKHTGEKPHACDICNRAFRIKYELKRHRLIHFDEKPWQCADCGLSFRQKRYLVNHKRINRGCATAKTVEAQGTKSDAAMDDSRDDEDSL